MSPAKEIPPRQRDALCRLATTVVEAMLGSGLDIEGQAAAIVHALVTWSGQLTPENQERFAEMFAASLIEMSRLARQEDGV